MNTSNLNKMVDEKYISVQKHPSENLYIYNYTQKCQFDRMWNEETMQCRGLITDEQFNVKARPFKKFFNYEEHTGEDSKLPTLPIEEFEVFEKMDGSLGILYWVNNTPFLATRGSFTSDQAIKGSDMLRGYSNVWNKDYTYLFEIIYPENRIVVDYGKREELVLLAVINTLTGEEMAYEQMVSLYSAVVPVVKRFDYTDIEKIRSIVEDNAEGFVIRFKSGVRTKLKFEEYKRLHRLVTGVNAKTIWELLKNNQPFDELMERVPDEFYEWVKNTRDDLNSKYKQIDFNCRVVVNEAKKFDNRKEQAGYILHYLSQYSGVCFSMLDNKDHAQIIWKMIKPRADKPWKEDIDA